MKRLPFLLIFMILGLSLANAQESDHFAESRELFYSYADPQEIRSSINMDYFTAIIEEDKALMEANQQLLLGLVALRQEDNDTAEAYFQRSYDICIGLLEEREDIELYRLVTSAGFSLAAVQGLRSIISMTDELDGYTTKILELSPQDPLGLIVRSQRLTFAPKIFGGNPEEAIQLLEVNLDQWDSIPMPLQFETLATLSYAWEKLKDKERAKDYGRQALALYPNNLDMQERMEEL